MRSGSRSASFTYATIMRSASCQLAVAIRYICPGRANSSRGTSPSSIATQYGTTDSA